MRHPHSIEFFLRLLNPFPTRFCSGRPGLHQTGVFYFASFIRFCFDWYAEASKSDILNQCWFNVGPASETLDQH